MVASRVLMASHGDLSEHAGFRQSLDHKIETKEGQSCLHMPRWLSTPTKSTHALCS